MEFEGKITVIGKEEEIGQNGLKKLSFVLEENSDKEYKSSVSVDLFNDKMEMIKAYKVGDVIKASLNFRAKEYNGRWFNSISAWRMEGVGGGSADAGAAPAPKSEPKNDDLPF